VKDRARISLLVSGIVQGVNFRYSTYEEARRLGVSGWVRNLPDGRVEVLAEGDRRALEALVDWCRRGPPHASVEAVEARWLAYAGDLEPFTVAR
jgi:acylphosphatase